MRIYRCYNDSSPKVGDIVALDDNEIQHLAAARRIRPGDQAILINGRGGEFAATIAESHKRALTLRVDQVLRQTDRPAFTLRLAAAITKGADYDDMMQRAVELGITHFQPLFTERVAVELDPIRTDKRVERWKRLAIESLKQCERLWLPVIEPPIHIDAFLAKAPEAGEQRVVLRERAKGFPALHRLVAETAYPRIPLSLLIGPEGGWTEKEFQAFDESGCSYASLGVEAVLRAETASLTALAILLGAQL